MASRQPLLPNWWEKKHTILSAVGGALVIVGIIAAVHFSGNADDSTWSDDKVETFLTEEFFAKRFTESVEELIKKLEANVQIPCAMDLQYVSTNIITMEKVDLQFAKIQTLTPAKSSPGRWNPLVKCDVVNKTYQYGNYVGQVNKDGHHGVGVYTFRDADHSYRGQWVNGKFDGVGQYAYHSGNVYLGQFKASVCHGEGKFTDKSAEKSYSGEWVDDEMDGMVT
eukprot:184111_1